FRIAPFADLAHRLVDIAGRGDDHALEPRRVLPAKVRHVAVIGTDHADFEGRIRQADEAEPGGRDQEVDVRSLVVHVLDAVFGLVVLHPGPRHLAAHPARLAAGEGLARCALAENPAVVFGADPIVVQALDTADRALPDGE